MSPKFTSDNLCQNNSEIDFVLLYSPSLILIDSEGMEKLKFSALTDDSGKITTINLSGSLILDSAHQLKKELLSAINKLNDSLSIRITDVDDMDITAIQLLVAFIRRMDQMKIRYQFDWQLNEEQKTLFSNVGIGSELFMPV